MVCWVSVDSAESLKWGLTIVKVDSFVEDSRKQVNAGTSPIPEIAVRDRFAESTGRPIMIPCASTSGVGE